MQNRLHSGLVLILFFQVGLAGCDLQVDLEPVSDLPVNETKASTLHRLSDGVTSETNLFHSTDDMLQKGFTEVAQGVYRRADMTMYDGVQGHLFLQRELEDRLAALLESDTADRRLVAHLRSQAARAGDRARALGNTARKTQANCFPYEVWVNADLYDVGGTTVWWTLRSEYSTDNETDPECSGSGSAEYLIIECVPPSQWITDTFYDSGVEFSITDNGYWNGAWSRSKSGSAEARVEFDTSTFVSTDSYNACGGGGPE